MSSQDLSHCCQDPVSPPRPRVGSTGPEPFPALFSRGRPAPASGAHRHSHTPASPTDLSPTTGSYVCPQAESRGQAHTQGKGEEVSHCGEMPAPCVSSKAGGPRCLPWVSVQTFAGQHGVQPAAQTLLRSHRNEAMLPGLTSHPDSSTKPFTVTRSCLDPIQCNNVE